ncbi:hypothetical protein HMN09_00731500 [Mycena chlorophos]|uniref:F-box domain-containing protein n=1 Tax=Mycena chlorophos TaxID=658473 RepID=A0A8H6W8P4_MYCCL|nr:hypothetical protein HMN09_00731500 [Mycena chlorophos]
MPPEPAYYPPEIISLICDEIEDRQTAARLGRVSRTFVDVAQRVLYHTVDLVGLPQRPVASWLSVVTRNARLANWVHSLSIQIPDPLSLQAKEAQAFAAAFRACVNLKELNTSCYGPKPTSSSTSTWMLEDCSFRLTTFVDSYFAFSMLEDFLSTQTELRVIVAPDFPSAAYFGEELDLPTLPNLVALCANIHSLPRHHPLQRIETTINRTDFPQLSKLACYSNTLTTLNVVASTESWATTGPPLPADIIRAVGAACPALRHLALTERPIGRVAWPFLRKCFPQNTARLSGCFNHFTHLETFACIGSREIAKPVLPDTTRLIAGTCATLRRVTISLLAPKRSCTATREVVGGPITVDEEDCGLILDDVSMFWVE